MILGCCLRPNLQRRQLLLLLAGTLNTAIICWQHARLLLTDRSQHRGGWEELPPGEIVIGPDTPTIGTGGFGTGNRAM